MSKSKKGRGASARRLKALRRKFKLGEFSKRAKLTKRARRSLSRESFVDTRRDKSEAPTFFAGNSVSNFIPDSKVDSAPPGRYLA